MRKKKKRMDGRYIFLIVGLAIIVIVAFLIYIVKTDRKLNPVEKVIKDATLSVCSVVYKPINFFKKQANLNKKYDKLQKKYNDVNLDKARMAELEKEVSDLKKMLDLSETLSEYDKINATVVNRKVGYWYNTITINKGEASGISKDMAVVTSEGLIGKVINTSYLYSTVRLLTSDELGQKVSVKIQIDDDRYIYGLLSSYDKDEKVFVIEGISENVELSEGMTVTTTGMSNIFPSGILVGTVKGIKKDNFDLTMLALVKPSTDFDDINYVSVLKRKSEIE